MKLIKRFDFGDDYSDYDDDAAADDKDDDDDHYFQIKILCLIQ